MDISSFLKKWSTFFVKIVNPFRENGQSFLWKRSTLFVEKVNPFCEKGQPFLWKRSTLSEKTVNPFWKNSRLFLKISRLFLKISRLFWEKLLTLFVDRVSFRNKKRGCVYFDTLSSVWELRDYSRVVTKLIPIIQAISARVHLAHPLVMVGVYSSLSAHLRIIYPSITPLLAAYAPLLTH